MYQQKGLIDLNEYSFEYLFGKMLYIKFKLKIKNAKV
jgi:hypothetical protein